MNEFVKQLGTKKKPMQKRTWWLGTEAYAKRCVAPASPQSTASYMKTIVKTRDICSICSISLIIAVSHLWFVIGSTVKSNFVLKVSPLSMQTLWCTMHARIVVFISSLLLSHFLRRTRHLPFS